MAYNILNQLLDKIKSEDDLPSGTGTAFRSLLLDYNLGWRELDIIRLWLHDYLDKMEQKEKNELLDIFEGTK